MDLIEEHHDRVVTLTLNRPDRLNALSGEMLDRLREALLRCDDDASVGVVVLTGAGCGFCAGGDVKRMADAQSLTAGAFGDAGGDEVAVLRDKMDISRLLHELSKPTIAMVNGPAAGAGLSLALACDLRIAGASATFTTAFAKVGLSGDFGGSYFLTQLVGSAKARELYFLSPSMGAQEALALGLVNQVVPDAELGQATAVLARRLAQGPTVAYGQMKRNFTTAESGSLADLLDSEARHQIAAGKTADHREAARSFVEKRTPVFRGV